MTCGAPTAVASIALTATQWQHDAGWELKARRPGRVEGAVEISIAVATRQPTQGRGQSSQEPARF
jgi:hypothetical protein